MKRVAFRNVVALLALAVAWVAAGCGSGSRLVAPAAPGARAEADWVTVTQLLPFQDQWPSSTPRWMDIGDYLYGTGFQATDSATLGTITFRYDPTPSDPRLAAEIRASGLKPNFCYQVKLVGKPGGVQPKTKKPTGLWGKAADMAGNEVLLRAGRWWNYRTEDPAFSTTNDEAAVASADYKAGWVAGYLVLDYFVTNQFGNTDADGDPTTAEFIPVSSSGSFHVVWKQGQNVPAAALAFPRQYTIARDTTFAYASVPAGSEQQTTTLYFEPEPDDSPTNLVLPDGTYDTVLMITEESFHSAAGSAGGYWRTVRVSDWPTTTSPRTGLPWVDPHDPQPVTFRIGPPPGTLSVAGVAVTLASSHGRWQATARVSVVDQALAPVAGAVVTGDWSGVAPRTGASAVTDAQGVAILQSSSVRASSGGFTFTVTNVSRDGYIWDGVPAAGTATIP